MAELKGKIIELSFQHGMGKLEVDDGRMMLFDVDACARRGGDPLPQIGELVKVEVGPSRLGGERVTRIQRIRAPRPTLDQALMDGALVPMGLADNLVRLTRHDDLACFPLTGGLEVGDVVGNRPAIRVAEIADVWARFFTVRAEGKVAFVVAEMTGATVEEWVTADPPLTTTSGSLCLFATADAAVVPVELAAHDGMNRGDFFARLTLGSGRDALWFTSVAPRAVMLGRDAANGIARIAIDLGIVETRARFVSKPPPFAR